MGFTINTAFADNVAEAELVPANDQEEAYITGLRRIEDGSIVSNSHTVKWRIFTDKGRDLFLKVSNSISIAFYCPYCFDNIRNVDRLVHSKLCNQAMYLMAQ